MHALCQALDRRPDGSGSTYLPTVREQLNPREIHMNNVINSYLQKLVAAAIAVAMTGVLAWSVIDSTTSGPSDQIIERVGA
jgi:hypothetical protein